MYQLRRFATSAYALSLNNLGNYSISRPVLLTESEVLDGHADKEKVLIHDAEYDKHSDLRYIDEKDIWVPTQERSIVDAIRQDSVQEEFLCHAIEDYLDFEGTIDDLRAIADRYNVLDTFDKYMKEKYNSFMYQHLEMA